MLQKTGAYAEDKRAYLSKTGARLVAEDNAEIIQVSL